jgi:hypothetical protein
MVEDCTWKNATKILKFMVYIISWNYILTNYLSYNMRRKTMKKLLQKSFTITLSLLLMLQIFIATVSAETAPKSDIQGHWAEKTMTEWISKGYLKGYPDGTEQPNKNIKRGEFITLVNKAFKLTGATDIHFSDLSTSDWAYNDISTAVKVGYIKGNEDGTISAGKPISREESAVMLSALLKLDNNAIPKFTDVREFAEWSKGAAGALAAKGIIKGYTDGSFRPKNNITRAEAVIAINQALNFQSSEVKTYNQAGIYGPDSGTETIEGNVEVNVPGVTLHNLIINGDLLLAEGIGNGDMTLDHVTVNGKTTIRGGGEHSIHISNSVLLTIIVNKKDGTIRIVAEGTTMVKSVIVQSSAKIEESGITGGGFSDVELSKELPADSNVTLKGTFDKVDVIATKISINIPEGSIQQLNVDKDASSSTITVDQLASIIDMILDSAVKVLGQGTIGNVTANDGAKGSSFEKLPTTLDGQAKNEVITPTPMPVPPVSNSNTGNTNSGNTPTIIKSNNADLKTLSVGALTLYQRDNMQHKGVAGFNSNVSYYVAETPIGYISADQIISIVPASDKSTVSFGLYDQDGGNAIRPSGPLVGTTEHFTLNPKAYLYLFITVTAEDGATSKQYNVALTWERKLSERIHMTSSGFVTVRGLSDGDIVRLYDTPTSTTSITEGTSQNDYLSIPIPDFVSLPNPTGSMTFSLQKINGLEEARVEYLYDFTPIDQSKLISGNGIEIHSFSAEELFDRQMAGYDIRQGVLATVYFNNLDPSISTGAKYFHFDTHSDSHFSPSVEDTKGISDDYFYTTKNSQGTQTWAMLTSQTVPQNQDIIVYFYDAGKNFIGYFNKQLMMSSPNAPLLSNVTSGTIVAGQNISVTSDKPSTLYLVPNLQNYHDNTNIINVAGQYTVSATSNQTVTINTTGLGVGTYYVYAIDAEGNVSLPSADITVVAAPTASIGTLNSASTLDLVFNKNIVSFVKDEQTTVELASFTLTNPLNAIITIANLGATIDEMVKFTIVDTDSASQQYVATFDGITWSLQAI